MKNCFYPADILLPDFKKYKGEQWAAIACDQFTSEPEYWLEAEKCVKDAPSALNLILPEAYLDQSEQRIPRINATMEEYAREVLRLHKNALIYLERTQSDGRVRRGIVGMIDLECYDFKKGSKSLIRATEGTVLERIPPRVAVRHNACLELPHVMLLIDDPEHTVIEKLSEKNFEVLYDFDLMLGGGHVTGRILPEEEIARVTDALENLVTEEAIRKRYGRDLPALLFAVGDGNHSLASAKTHYEQIKSELGCEVAKDHPARYALVELVNLHDSALEFEPIYRIMFGVDPQVVIKELSAYAQALHGDAAAQSVRYINGTLDGMVSFEHPEQQLTVGTLQTFIDDYLKAHPEASVDYIHGIDSTLALCKREDAIGFIFDGMEKEQLFLTVMLDGALPRKTFSMGQAKDKRYYIEARKIK